MTTRYFKAADADQTVFRATKTKVYASANITAGTFSTKPACLGTRPTTEITKAEYDGLVALKAERIRAKYAPETPPRWAGGAPCDSWVWNAQL